MAVFPEKEVVFGFSVFFLVGESVEDSIFPIEYHSVFLIPFIVDAVSDKFLFIQDSYCT